MNERRSPVTRKVPTRCFGCGPDNPIGCQLKIAWDGDKASAQFVPGELHAGWDDVVHGGILCVLLDEVMSYVPYFQGLLSVTGRMQVRFRQPARPGERLLITASVARLRRQLMETRGTICREDGTVVAEGSALMWITGKE